MEMFKVGEWPPRRISIQALAKEPSGRGTTTGLVLKFNGLVLQRRWEANKLTTRWKALDRPTVLLVIDVEAVTEIDSRFSKPRNRSANSRRLDFDDRALAVKKRLVDPAK